MKKVLFALLVLLNIGGVANAAVYNSTCSSQTNTIYYNHDGIYNHGWIYVNGNEIGDFWTVSSGSDTYVTSLNSGDHVLVLWYNTSEGYGSDNVICD